MTLTLIEPTPGRCVRTLEGERLAGPLKVDLDLPYWRRRLAAGDVRRVRTRKPKALVKAPVKAPERPTE